MIETIFFLAIGCLLVITLVFDQLARVLSTAPRREQEEPAERPLS
jgi:hypothetical protein